MTEPLSPEREQEIRALDFRDLIRHNDAPIAAQTAVSVVCTLLNEIDRLRAEHDELLAELDGRDEEASERWIEKTLAETGIKAMDFRGGMSMELEPAREMVAHWVGAARGMLGDAENYSETPVEMVVKVAESPETFAFTLQRVGKVTPHQARQRAEQERDRLRAALEKVADIGNVQSCMCSDDDCPYAAARAALATETAREQLAGQGGTP